MAVHSEAVYVGCGEDCCAGKKWLLLVESELTVWSEVQFLCAGGKIKLECVYALVRIGVNKYVCKPSE
jgi:hypothetical protein